MASSPLKKFLPLLLLAVVFMFGSQFMANSLGTMDAHSNVSVEYQGQYNDTRNTSIITLSLTHIIPLLLGAFGFIVLLIYIQKRSKRR